MLEQSLLIRRAKVFKGRKEGSVGGMEKRGVLEKRDVGAGVMG